MNDGRRRRLGRPRGAPFAGAALAVVVGLAVAAPAAAQVSGGRLLSWCQGGMGSAATATFDAFQCSAYLQANLDQRAAEDVAFEECLGTATPDGADLLARLLPHLEDLAARDAEALQQPASRIVGGWIAENCATDDAATAEAPQPVDPDPPQADPLAMEMALWEATQQIGDPDRRVEAIHHYLDAYPDGRFRVIAQLQLDDLAATAAAEGSQAEGSAEGEQNGTDADADAGSEDTDSLFWISIKDSDDPADYQTYLDRFPDGLMTDIARARIQALTVPPDEPDSPAPVVITPRDDPAAPGRLAALEAGLSRADRVQIQRALARLGYYRMGIDGIFGPGTRRAIEAFQDRIGTDRTGYLTGSERQRLFVEAPAAAAVAAAPANTTPQDLLVVNNTPNAVFRLFVNPNGSFRSTGNLLGNAILLPGTNQLVRPTTAGGSCLVTVIAIDEFGNTYMRRNIDACRQQEVRLR